MIRKTASTKRLAEGVFKKFAEAEGNQHIASMFAIQKILDIIKINKPQRILEIGLGIGSISAGVLEFCNQEKTIIEYYGTEANEFCLRQLQVNLRQNYTRLKCYDTINEIPGTMIFDMVIVDGTDESLKQVNKIIHSKGVIFIEGDRSVQVSQLKELFPANVSVKTISNFKHPEYGPFSHNDWCGGGTIIYVNPTLLQLSHYWIEKVRSAYRYRFVRKRR